MWAIDLRARSDRSFLPLWPVPSADEMILQGISANVSCAVKNLSC